MIYFLNGGRNERGVLEHAESLKLYERLGVQRALIIPYAIMEDEWQRLWHENTTLFTIPGLEISSITTYDIDKNVIERAVAEADFIYLPGGSQKTLLQRMEKLGTGEILRAAVQGGRLKLLGGGSAGAMVMGTKCIVGRNDVTDVVDGLEFLSGHIVDSHFMNRHREARFLEVLQKHPDLTGIGIDEDTAAIFEDDFALQAVYGAGTVSLYYANKKERYDSNSTFNI